MIVLGIDPGARTGLALYGTNDANRPQLIDAVSIDWGETGQEVKDRLKLWQKIIPHLDLVAVEIPRQGGALFRHGRAIPSQMGKALKMARNVGACYAKAESLAGYCEGLGLKVVRKEPASGGTKRGVTAETWKAIFPEFQRQTSEHSRDAALLARRVWDAARFMARIEDGKGA